MDTSARQSRERDQIVVGVDGSPSGRAALIWALREAVASGSAVQAILVWHEHGVFAPVNPAAAIPLAERRHPGADDYRRRLQEIVADARHDVPGAPTVTERVVEGRPRTELVAAAGDARLLVVGSHGHGRIGAAVLGSVSEACVRDADCPVMIVGPDVAADASAGTAHHARPTG